MVRQAKAPSSTYFSSVSVALQIVAALILILIASTAYYELISSRNAIVKDTERQLSRLDMVFAEQTGRAVEAVDLLILGAAETLHVQPQDAGGFADMFRRRISGVRQLSAILAFDEHGLRTLSTDLTMPPTPADVLEPLLARYRADPHGDLTISPPFRVTDNRWNALLVRPLTTPDGKFAGIICGSINLSYFEDFYRAVELSENGAINLHLRDGTMLARFPHVDDMIGTSFGNLPPFTEILAHAQAGTLLMEGPVDGTIRVLAVRALRAFPLVVIVSVEHSRLLVDWQHEAMALICVALLLGGAVVILLLSLSRRSRQVENLLEGTRIAHDIAEQARDRLLQQISERERAEGALRQAQRIEAIGQLTGGVAHDFNNLLTVVLGNVEILQRKLATDALLMQRLGAIRAAAERGANLTGHLLAFARRQPLMPKATDLNATVRGMENLLNSALGVLVTVRFRLAERLWPAMVDQSQIELLILNLVINARDAMPEGGIITIETDNHRQLKPAHADGAPPGDYVTITVRDTGTGIEPEVLGRVFEPFFTTKAPGAGSGLGLSQVFGTAKQSGGGVQIHSEVGRGTVVIVELPRATNDPPAAHQRSRVANQRPSRALILLVDDDDAVRAVTAAMLRDCGYDVIDVSNGEAALTAMMGDRAFELMLTDLVMPGMNGSQLATIVRTKHPDLPIVFISGYVDQLDSTLTPGDRLIRKPFSAGELRHVIEDVVAGHPAAMSKA